MMGTSSAPEQHVRSQDPHVFLDAALEAEQRTGDHEPTTVAARPHLVVRLGRMAAGFLVLLAGVMLLVLPGPGLALIIAGLSILSVDIAFARRLRTALIERSDRATGFLPKRLRTGLLVAGSASGLVLSGLLIMR
jgi:hypothetical protein